MAKVLICGGNGKVGRLLASLLRQQYTVTSIIRDEAQSSSIRELGAAPKVFSLEHSSVEEMTAVVQDQDIVVWSAGAGGKGGAERTMAVDRDAAVRMIEACSPLRKRFIMVSALTSREPDDMADWWSESDRATFTKGYHAIQKYHEAKVAADKALMASGNRWTIVRPGRLTDDAATGKIKAGRIDLEGSITRADVAAAIRECITNEQTSGLNIDMLNGDVSIHDAIKRVAAERITSL